MAPSATTPCLAGPATRWVLYPIEGGEAQPVPALAARDIPVQWSEDGRFVYIVDRRDGPPQPAFDVSRVELSTGRRILWKTLAPLDPVGAETFGQVVMTPDGEFVLLFVHASPRRPVRCRRAEVSGRVCFGDFVLDPGLARTAPRKADRSRSRRRRISCWRSSSPAAPRRSRRSRFRSASGPTPSWSRRTWSIWSPRFGSPSATIRRIRASCARSTGSATHFGSPGDTPADDARPGHAVRFRLVWADGRAGLGDGEHVLGRDPDLDLFLDSPGVSRRHALIRITGDEATLEDLGSKNGTFVADRRLDSPTRLVTATSSVSARSG